jgi:hypothetical protein
LAGKWIFQLDEEKVKSSECEDDNSQPIQINPTVVSIFGQVPIELSGPCVNQTSVDRSLL